MPPTEFLNAFVGNGFSERVKLFEQLPTKAQMLLACSWGRLALPTWNKICPHDNRPLIAIQTAEGHVLGTRNKKQVASAAESVWDAVLQFGETDAAARTAYWAVDAARGDEEPVYVRASVSRACACAALSGVSWEEIYKLYLHTKGSDYQFRPEWKTGDVTALVKGIVKDKAFDRMPILADALQDAGLEDPDLLIHLQQDQCYLSDWVIWNVMGFDK